MSKVVREPVQDRQICSVSFSFSISSMYSCQGTHVRWDYNVLIVAFNDNFLCNFVLFSTMEIFWVWDYHALPFPSQPSPPLKDRGQPPWGGHTDFNKIQHFYKVFFRHALDTIKHSIISVNRVHAVLGYIYGWKDENTVDMGTLLVIFTSNSEVDPKSSNSS